MIIADKIAPNARLDDSDSRRALRNEDDADISRADIFAQTPR